MVIRNPVRCGEVLLGDVVVVVVLVVVVQGRLVVVGWVEVEVGRAFHPG